MEESLNAAVLRRGFEAYAKRDMSTLADLFSDDVTWHNHGRNPLSGDYQGKHAVFSMFAHILEINGGTGAFDVHDIVANDEHAVALLRASTSRPGTDKTLNVKEIHVCHVHDGKIAEVWIFSEDQRLNDEFWS